MAGVWARYNAALAAKPLQTKTLTSFFGFTIGDLIAQAPSISNGESWDSWRTTKMATFGLLLHGPIGHYWYNFLDRSIMTAAPKSAAAVASKTAIDQILWAPVFTSIFFSTMKTLDGEPPSACVEEVKTKLWPTMKVNWSVWPLAHLINFRFVPSSQRILYINTVQIGYNAFLSTMQAKKGTPKPMKEASRGLKDLAEDARREAREGKEGAKDIAREGKDAVKTGYQEGKGELKEGWQDLKASARDSKGDMKDAWQSTKQEARETKEDLKSAFDRK